MSGLAHHSPSPPQQLSGEFAAKVSFAGAPTGDPRGLAPERAKTLPLGAFGPLGRMTRGAIDALLPDGGLPRGAVIELASSRALGRSTSVALAACSAAQAEARLRSGDPKTVGAWCAFVDPWSTLHAPAVKRSGVDTMRLLVVRPSIEALPRIAVRIVQSRAFSMIAIDLAGVPGAELQGDGAPTSVRLDRWVNIVRRLALALEKTDASVLLLTDLQAPRALPLPVAMRLELDCDVGDVWSLRIAKERHGRVSPKMAITDPKALLPKISRVAGALR